MKSTKKGISQKLSKLIFQKSEFKMKQLIIMTFLIALLTSCGSYEPPKQYDYQKKKIFNESYDEVWENIIEYFSMSNLPIENMEKASGFIKTEINKNNLEEFQDSFDCGKLSSSVKINSYTISFNISVKEDRGTVVNINSFVDVEGMNVKYYNVKCISTGEFEKKLFTFIRNN